MPKYQPPDFFTQRIMNPLIMLVGKTTGMTMKNTHTLSVRGRTSGAMHSVPVSPLEFEGQRYLVAPRGTTQWVRNIRVSGEGELRLGRKRERITVQEIEDGAKAPILRAYLKVWESEMKKFFNGVGPDASAEELRKEAADHPVFRIASGTKR
ncbi:MAG: nitroreductase/quinone reductase family protein [Dehalococcoidia bacterium]